MIIKGDNGTYLVTCGVCGAVDDQTYLVLQDLGEGNIQFVHPVAERRCQPSVETVYEQEDDESRESDRSWGDA